MNKFYSIFLLTFLVVHVSTGQYYYQQYFDGTDTIPSKALFIELDTSSSNIWQIGPPQKVIFDSAATTPNVLITDTINNIPSGITSSFTFAYAGNYSYGVLALRWKQKLDLSYRNDGAFIEYSIDTGNTWLNVFDNPYVYNFYGFDTANVDTVNNKLAFTGTDSTWKDIWLCFDHSFIGSINNIIFRFTIATDTVNTDTYEGWIIDNLILHNTKVHTVKTTEAEKYMKIYPTNTTGRVYIETEKLQEYHIIENIQLVNTEGRVVQEWGRSPTKFFIDIGNQPNGQYYLKVKTNKKQETFRILLNK